MESVWTLNFSDLKGMAGVVGADPDSILGVGSSATLGSNAFYRHIGFG